jgi:hypothetical protein
MRTSSSVRAGTAAGSSSDVVAHPAISAAIRV